MNFRDWKRRITEEYQWLREVYPIEEFGEIPLKIYNAKDYNESYGSLHQDEYKEKEIDAFVTDMYMNDEIKMAIFLIISEDYEKDKSDEIVLKNGNIEEKHFYYWLLYHEYGHLLQLQRTYNKHGVKGIMEQKEEESEEVDKITSLYFSGKISDEEYDIKYRELWFEKEADNTANKIYDIRKQNL